MGGKFCQKFVQRKSAFLSPAGVWILVEVNHPLPCHFYSRRLVWIGKCTQNGSRESQHFKVHRAHLYAILVK